jgi:hypothetical protein
VLIPRWTLPRVGGCAQRLISPAIKQDELMPTLRANCNGLQSLQHAAIKEWPIVLAFPPVSCKGKKRSVAIHLFHLYQKAPCSTIAFMDRLPTRRPTLPSVHSSNDGSLYKRQFQ